jgi:hypothetical protein
MLEWIIENRTWLFSGVAISIPIAILGRYFSKRDSKQVQRGGDNSTNLQVGGNITIGDKKND